MNRREMMTASLGALLAPQVASAQPSSGSGHDIAVLRQALALHPGLYRYSTPTQIDERLTALDYAWARTPALDERYLLLSRFLGTLRCGHSYANFVNQSKVVAAQLFERPTRLPVQFRWIDERMIVTGDPSATGLAPGTEILTVGDVPARQLLATLMPYARADGHNDAKRRALLSVAGTEQIETFDIFLGLLAGPPRDHLWRLAIRRPDGRRVACALPAIDLKARQAQQPPTPAADAPRWSWTVRQDGVAILTMPSWAVFDSKWDWRAWLEDRLDSLIGAKGLVIDIRDNEGGLACGNVILARLTSTSPGDAGVERRVRFRRTPPALDPFLDTWDASFRHLGENAVALGDGFYRLPDRPDEAIAPSPKRLDLPIAVLIGPTNSSATYQFAANARRSGRARLIGEATGGNQRGINGGAFFFVRLPDSGIEFDLPLIGVFPPGSPPDAGLLPDEVVTMSAADIAARHDSVLESALKWIGRA